MNDDEFVPYNNLDQILEDAKGRRNPYLNEELDDDEGYE